MNRRREREAVPVVKICFDPACAASCGRIEMDGYENRVGIRVGDCNARSQWNEDVAVPGHYYAITAGCEDTFKSLRDIQCHLFLGDPLAWNPAAVIATVSCIDHYGNG